MKVSQLLESSAITISPSNVDAQYKIGSIQIDNDGGLGNTPMGKNVQYQGFVAFIKPSVFLKLAHKEDRTEDAAKIEKLVKQGQSIASPFIELNGYDPDSIEDTKLRVVGHEGRARMLVISRDVGDIPVPVQFFVRGGIRARHLTPEFFDKFSTDLVKCQDGPYTVIRPTRIFCDGKEI